MHHLPKLSDGQRHNLYTFSVITSLLPCHEEFYDGIAVNTRGYKKAIGFLVSNFSDKILYVAYYRHTLVAFLIGPSSHRYFWHDMKIWERYLHIRPIATSSADGFEIIVHHEVRFNFPRSV